MDQQIMINVHIRQLFSQKAEKIVFAEKCLELAIILFNVLSLTLNKVSWYLQYNTEKNDMELGQRKKEYTEDSRKWEFWSGICNMNVDKFSSAIH